MDRIDRIVLRTVLRRIRLAVRGLKALVLPVDRRRWARVAHSEPVWDVRNRRIAELVGQVTSVIDIGSGAQTLKRYLPEGTCYQPCDVVKSSDDVLLCNFNAGQYPAVTEVYDVAVCSGVVEYVRKVEPFVDTVVGYARRIILTYAPMDPGDNRLKRLGRGWVNHLRQHELEALFDRLGLAWSIIDTWDDYNRHVIYRIEGRVPDGTGETT